MPGMEKGGTDQSSEAPSQGNQQIEEPYVHIHIYRVSE